MHEESELRALVKDWMTPNPITATARINIPEARQLLEASQIRHLPIVEGRRVIGILTDRDLRTASMAALIGRTVETLMRTKVLTVEPETPLADAARIMLQGHLGCLPVVTDGELVGILTDRDILRAVATGHSLTQEPGP